ncbi:MAG TPA: hypothetical protein VHP33_18420 [Polyangiaceae bacterium]|nr:hypothetical protein [Polyangiaceae bacterium]
MSGDNPTLKDVWRLLGTMNKRFDGLERQIVQVRADLTQQIVETRTDLEALKAEMRLGFGALKEAIEARDFRLDDHGRRLTELESRS